MSDTDKKENEVEYQVYKSSMQAHKLIMPSGKVLHVTNGKFVTCNQDEIDFIDDEISKGFKYLKKGGTTTSATADPMAAMTQRIKEEAVREYLAKEMKEAGGGKTETTETPPVIKPEVVVTLSEPIKPASTTDLSALTAKLNASK